MAALSSGLDEVVKRFSGLTLSKRVAFLSLSCGGIALYFISKWLRRKRKSIDPNRSIRAVRRARKISFRSGSIDEGTGNASLNAKKYHDFNWSELQQQMSSDQDSVASGATLVDGTPLTPQQLGLMGLEALETVVSYWEDALAAYRPATTSLSHHSMIMSGEEAKFMRQLEAILEEVYQLQEESESIFIYEQSLLNRRKKKSDELEFYKKGTESLNNLLSVSTVDNDSFVSAQDTIADLTEFNAEDFISRSEVEHLYLYKEALAHLDASGIPYRAIRTEFVGVETDAEYLAKLHCLRLAFKSLMEKDEVRNWWIDTGRQILSDLMVKSDKDPKDFVTAFDDLIEFLNCKEHIDQMHEELQARNVQCTNFYDVVLDYILIDSFEDLESPPSSVLAVMRNRWLSDGFKESALSTAIWSVLKAKRRLVKYPDGFKAQFYNMSEILTPALAWGFFGPDEALNRLMNFFKDQVMGFIRDLYNFEKVRFTNLEEMCQDVMKLAHQRLETTLDHLSL